PWESQQKTWLRSTILLEKKLMHVPSSHNKTGHELRKKVDSRMRWLVFLLRTKRLVRKKYSMLTNILSPIHHWNPSQNYHRHSRKEELSQQETHLESMMEGQQCSLPQKMQ